jgi:transposase InsO family protein
VVSQLAGEGYSIKRICQVLSISRSGYYRKLRQGKRSQRESVKKKEEASLKAKIREICLNHPFWGTRRVTVWLRKREGITINRKRVQRLMREEKLILKSKKKPASRGKPRKKPVPNRPNQWWGIDMTKFLIEDVGWIYLVAVVDWYSRKVVGHAMDVHCRSELWIQALESAVLNEFPNGSRDENLFLMSDNGSQPTSQKFMHVAGILGIQQTFTSYNNPKGNANTERWFRTFKEDCVWINEWSNIKEARKDVLNWIEFYNNDYIHSALNGMSPNEFLAQYSLKNVA